MSQQNSRNKLFSLYVRKFIWQYPDLKYDNETVVCLICNKRLLCWNRALCIRHVNSEDHKNKKHGQNTYDQFLFDLIFMMRMSACNLPLNIIEKQPFRQFWKKYSPTRGLPSRTTLRKYLPRTRERLENNIKYAVQDKKLSMVIEETTDLKGNFVVNVIVRPLSPFEVTRPYLLASKRLQQRTSDAVNQLVLVTLQKFRISRNQLLILVTDGGSESSMFQIGYFFKTVSPNLLHISCVLRSLHHVAEVVRNCYPEVDALITHTKNVFHKSPKLIREFHRLCPGIPNPPEPIIPQWGTWLQAAFYYLQYFQEIKFLVLQLNPKQSVAVKESQLRFQDLQIREDLQNIHKNYAVVADAINELENSSLPLSESFSVLDKVQSALQSLSDNKGVCVAEKFDSELSRNSDLLVLREIFNSYAVTNSSDSLRNYFTFANITSMDAEWSFSLYKKAFSSLRTSLTETTMETYAMLQMFTEAQTNSNGDCEKN